MRYGILPQYSLDNDFWCPSLFLIKTTHESHLYRWRQEYDLITCWNRQPEPEVILYARERNQLIHTRVSQCSLHRDEIKTTQTRFHHMMAAPSNGQSKKQKSITTTHQATKARAPEQKSWKFPAEDQAWENPDEISLPLKSLLAEIRMQRLTREKTFWRNKKDGIRKRNWSLQRG